MTKGLFWWKKRKEVQLLEGDGLGTALKVLRDVPSRIFPLFFLDGDHRFSSVERELNGIFKRVPKSVVLVHDTFYQSQDSNFNVGPYRAVSEFLRNRGDKFSVLKTDTGLPGMTLLFPRDILSGNL